MTGDLYWSAPGRLYQSGDVIGFRQQLPDAMLGKPLMIGDGAPIHRSRAVRERRSPGAARRLRPERLPGYASELNPEKGFGAAWSA